MEIVQISVAVTTILTAVGGLVVFAVVRPLNQSIQDLRGAINELRMDLRANSERLNRIEGEVRELHHAVQKAHDRIDDSLKSGGHHVPKN